MQNEQIENQTNQIGNNGTAPLLIIIIVLLIAVGGYLFYGSVLKKDSVNDKNQIGDNNENQNDNIETYDDAYWDEFVKEKYIMARGTIRNLYFSAKEDMQDDKTFFQVIPIEKGLDTCGYVTYQESFEIMNYENTIKSNYTENGKKQLETDLGIHVNTFVKCNDKYMFIIYGSGYDDSYVSSTFTKQSITEDKIVYSVKSKYQEYEITPDENIPGEINYEDTIFILVKENDNWKIDEFTFPGL